MPVDVASRVVQCATRPDLRSTYGLLVRGAHDPASRFDGGAWLRAWHTPDGPVTTRLTLLPADGAVHVEAWGTGAPWVCAHAVDIVGEPLGDAPAITAHPLLRELARRAAGLHVVRTGAVYDAAVGTVLEQRITSLESRQQWARLVRTYGRPAPGPVGLRLAPDPATLASVPAYELHALGIEQRRAATLQRVAAHLPALDAAATAPPPVLARRLAAIPGVGPWTRAYLVHAVQGDADAVPVGDWHFPSHIAWALAGEPRADDARMLALLEPFRPHRGWAWRLLVGGTPRPPRRAPRARITNQLRNEHARARGDAYAGPRPLRQA